MRERENYPSSFNLDHHRAAERRWDLQLFERGQRQRRACAAKGGDIVGNVERDGMRERLGDAPQKAVVDGLRLTRTAVRTIVTIRRCARQIGERWQRNCTRRLVRLSSSLPESRKERLKETSTSESHFLVTVVFSRRMQSELSVSRGGGVA